VDRAYSYNLNNLQPRGLYGAIVNTISAKKYQMPSVLWHCWLGVRKSLRSVKKASDEVRVWLSVLSENANDLYGAVHATATPSSLASLKSRWFAALASYSDQVSSWAFGGRSACGYQYHSFVISCLPLMLIRWQWPAFHFSKKDACIIPNVFQKKIANRIVVYIPSSPAASRSSRDIPSLEAQCITKAKPSD